VYLYHLDDLSELVASLNQPLSDVIAQVEAAVVGQVEQIQADLLLRQRADWLVQQRGFLQHGVQRQTDEQWLHLATQLLRVISQSPRSACLQSAEEIVAAFHEKLSELV